MAQDIELPHKNVSPSQAIRSSQESKEFDVKPVLYYVYPLSILVSHREAQELLTRAALTDLSRDFSLVFLASPFSHPQAESRTKHAIFLDYLEGRDDCLVMQAVSVDSLKRCIKAVRRLLEEGCRSFHDRNVLKGIPSLRSEEMLFEWSHDTELEDLPPPSDTLSTGLVKKESCEALVPHSAASEPPAKLEVKENGVLAQNDRLKLNPKQASSSDMALSSASHKPSTAPSLHSESSDKHVPQSDELQAEAVYPRQADSSAFYLYTMDITPRFRARLLGKGRGGGRARIQEIRDLVNLEEPLYVENDTSLHIMGSKGAIQSCITELRHMGRERDPGFSHHSFEPFEPRFRDELCKMIQADGPIEDQTNKRLFIQGSAVEDALYSPKLRGKHKLYIAVHALVDAVIVKEEGDRYLVLRGTPNAIAAAEDPFKRLITEAENSAARLSENVSRLGCAVDFSQVDLSLRDITTCSVPLPSWVPHLLLRDRAAILKEMRHIPGIRFCDVRDHRSTPPWPSPVLLIKGDRMSIKSVISMMVDKVGFKELFVVQNDWFATDGAAEAIFASPASSLIFGPPATGSHVSSSLFAPDTEVTYFLPIPSAVARSLLERTTRMEESLRISVPKLRRAVCKSHTSEDAAQYSPIGYILLHGAWNTVSEAAGRVTQYGQRVAPWWQHNGPKKSCMLQEERLSSEKPSTEMLKDMHSTLSEEMARSLLPKEHPFWLDQNTSVLVLRYLYRYICSLTDNSSFKIANNARGAVFGTARGTILRLESESFASITIDRDDYVVIKGFPSPVRLAAQKVVDILRNPQERGWYFSPSDELLELLDQSSNSPSKEGRKRSGSPMSSADKRQRRTNPWE